MIVFAPRLPHLTVLVDTNMELTSTAVRQLVVQIAIVV